MFLFPCDSKTFAQHPFYDFKIVFIILKGGRDSFQKSVLSTHGGLGGSDTDPLPSVASIFF